MKLSLTRILIFVCLFVFHVHVVAQEMPENASSKEILAFIIQQKHSNPDLAKKYTQILLEKSRTTNDTKGIFNAHFQHARIATIEGDYTLAIHSTHLPMHWLWPNHKLKKF